ncbi:MFS transporter [Thermoactinospora rubra]|uniref:MFS transporter n=1 Tax=Thermoactinospora rubra TaxID=1088767 RepID=UPI000A11439E|nr:MFS transporter [Thermoactinospora rubra]
MRGNAGGAVAPATGDRDTGDRDTGDRHAGRHIENRHAGGRRGWAAVAALAAGAFTTGTDMFVAAGILGGIARDLGVTAGAAGLTVTVFAVTYATGAVLLSALLSARPARRVLIGSMALFGTLSVLSALAPSFPVLLAARGMAALAASVYVPAAGAAAVEAVPPSHRGRALGGTSAAMVAGTPLGMLLASALSWRAAFGLVAALAAVTVLALLRTGAGGSCRLTRASLRERLRPLGSPAVAGVLGVTFLVMTASFGMYTYLPLLLAAAPVALGVAAGAFGVGGMAGTWWGGAAADRSGARRVVVLTVSLLATGFWALPLLATSAAGTLAVVAGWGLAAWGFIPAQQHRLIGSGGGPPPLLLALNSSAVHLGSAAGALFGGLVVDAAGAGALWSLAVTCCAAGLALHTMLTGKAG